MHRRNFFNIQDVLRISNIFFKVFPVQYSKSSFDTQWTGFDSQAVAEFNWLGNSKSQPVKNLKIIKSF